MKRGGKLLIMLALLAATIVACIFLPKLFEEEPAPDFEVTQYEINLLDSFLIDKIVIEKEGSEPVELSKGSDGAWYIGSSPADEELCDTMTLAVEQITSENCLMDVSDEKLSAYGLDTPTLTVKISSGADSRVLNFGILNPSINEYYLSLGEDKSTVYTVSVDLFDAFNKSADELLAEVDETEAVTDTEE